MIDKRCDPASFRLKLEKPVLRRCLLPVANLTKDNETVSQVLYGEQLLDFGHGLVQSKHDDYVGIIDLKAIGEDFTPTHKVNTPLTWGLTAPKVQAIAKQAFYYGSQVKVIRIENSYARLDIGLYLPVSHLSKINTPKKAIDVALLFINAPYLWGGRSPHGIDCSGLTQVAFATANVNLPRDSDMQEKCGEEVALHAALQTGDLVFWKGHVGMMLDGKALLHANGFHMKTIVEPLKSANKRITAQTGAGLRAIRRFPQLR